MKTPQQILDRIAAILSRVDDRRHDIAAGIHGEAEPLDFEVEHAEQGARALREEAEAEVLEIACDIGEFFKSIRSPGDSAEAEAFLASAKEITESFRRCCNASDGERIHANGQRQLLRIHPNNARGRDQTAGLCRRMAAIVARRN